MEEKRKQSYIDTDSTHAKRRSGREKETELYIDTGSTHAKRRRSGREKETEPVSYTHLRAHETG